jgi:hypothetical protein
VFRVKRVVMVEWHHEHGFSLRSNHMLRSRLKPILPCILQRMAIRYLIEPKRVDLVG